MLETVGLYVPQHNRAILDYLTGIADRQRWPVREIIWCWQDVLQAMAGGEVDLVLATSLADLPAQRRPRIVFADELPPSTLPRQRPQWRR